MASKRVAHSPFIVGDQGFDSDRNQWYPQPIADPTAKYKASDVDEAADPKYYGYVDVNGAWYIMEKNVAAGTFRYIKGDEDYSTNWAAHSGLEYDHFNEVF